LPAPELLVTPESEQPPRISVLIPVHNHWAITLNALRSLVAMANGTSFEVIVADDGSTDATTQLGRQLPWLRIWRSEQNQGFLDTCNGAAELARGELLLLLNNDTLVGDHALDRLVQTFAHHPEAGVVGAASWSADGRPQEVGGIVWANGQVWNHGRNAPPEHRFALAYERECDYVSGCALAIRTQLWQQLEGFDPRYRPAYCEDTDLCLRVREAGHSVWVQPTARILHLEGLSHSRDASQGLKQHQVRNLEQLKERWQHTLDTEQAPEGWPTLLAADRRLLGRPLVLLLQPTTEGIARCRQLGYGVVALGESPQADVMGMPLGWQGLNRWLIDQLPESGPEVVLLGTQDGDAGELSKRLQHFSPRWLLVARATELPRQPNAMRLPALPGWDREDLRILASSKGLHSDGWLETPSRLLIQLTKGGLAERIVQMNLYLPEVPEDTTSARVFEIKTGAPATNGGFCLHPGLNQITLSLVPRSNHVVEIEVSGPALDTGQAVEQRRLLAVLAGLEPLPLANSADNPNCLIGEDLRQGIAT